MIRRFQNRNDLNGRLFRAFRQRKFNYHDQVPHHGQDFHYAGGTYVPDQTSGPTIPTVGPLHQPQPGVYCKICEVSVGSYNNVEAHNNGKKHRRKLSLHEELERVRISNGQIPNSQEKLEVQSKTVLKSGKNGCSENNVSSETTVAKHRNYLQKDIGVTPEVPVEGKPFDDTSAQGHNFKHKIGGGKTGKYMKTNNGLRRPMESSKHDIDSPWPAVTYDIMAPSPVVGSSFKLVYQQVLASQAQVLEGKEYHEIQNPTVETNDHPHTPADSNIYTQPEDVSSDFAARELRPPKVGYCKICEVHLPYCKTLEMHNQENSHQRMLKLYEETQRLKTSNGLMPNSQNQLLPSVVVEFNSPSGSSINTHTADGCSKAEQTIDILAHQSGTTQLSQVAVCLQCGNAGFPETLVFCNKCQVYALHRYCLDGPVIFIDDVTWFCEDCEAKVTSFHDSCTLLPSGKNVSLNSGNDASQAIIEPKSFIESVKNKQEPQNIAAKTMVLLSDNHGLSHHGLSQCINNTEKENKFEKECQPDPKDEANTSDSLNATVPYPIADPVWRGSLCISDPSFGTAIGLLAHVSTLASPKVLEETRFFPDVLCPDLHPRTGVWPKSFMKCGPNMDSVALYFFPDSESVERTFHKLIEDMMYFDLSLRAVVENADLLIFPSILLPIQCRRFQEKYYLWGVFRAKKPSQ